MMTNMTLQGTAQTQKKFVINIDQGQVFNGKVCPNFSLQ